MEDRWELHVMGCRGSFPICGEQFHEFGEATSCYVLHRGGHAVVVDCGTGLDLAKPLLHTCSQIDVLLTHVHYDHIIGLLAGGVFPPAAQLRFISHFSQWFGPDTLRRFISPPFWPYTWEAGELVEVPSPGEIELDDGVRITFSSSNHPDCASLVRADTPDGSVCFAFDYEHSGPFPKALAEGCGLLLYDATYTHEEYRSRVGWGHSFWEKGCELAEELKIGRLIFVHHDPAKSDDVLRKLEKEAQAVFPAARYARQGDVYPLSKQEV